MTVVNGVTGVSNISISILCTRWTHNYRCFKIYVDHTYVCNINQRNFDRPILTHFGFIMYHKDEETLKNLIIDIVDELKDRLTLCKNNIDVNTIGPFLQDLLYPRVSWDDNVIQLRYYRAIYESTDRDTNLVKMITIYNE